LRKDDIRVPQHYVSEAELLEKNAWSGDSGGVITRSAGQATEIDGPAHNNLTQTWKEAARFQTID